MSKEIEDKLDEDFLFYLGFTTGLVNKFADKEEFKQCQTWLQKLVGQRYQGVEQKRYRNIYLSQLVLCVEEGKLTGPFLQNPNEVDISDALKVFGPAPTEVGEPEWLSEIKDVHPSALNLDNIEDDGRTYLATRTLPNGQGAFAYLAVTLADEEPKWLGGGESVLDAMMGKKFCEMNPQKNEMEEALARRKDPQEIQKVIAFYDGVLRNIAEELDGVICPSDNKTVNHMMDQLVEDLINKNEFDPKEDAKKEREKLLLKLHERVLCRKNTVIKRQDALDDLERSILPESFFDFSMCAQDQVSFPAAMWQAAINKDPTRKHMNQLRQTYCSNMVDRFLQLLFNEKEEIAIRMQRRHEHIVSQMKKELRKEAEKGQKWVDEAKQASDQFFSILQDVRVQKERRDEALERRRSQNKRGGVTEKTAIYEQMRRQLIDTQKSVEDEAEFGRQLAEEINIVNAQTEQMQQITNESIMNVEEANMKLMRNIRNLRVAIKQYEARIRDIQKSTQVALQGKAQKLLVLD